MANITPRRNKKGEIISYRVKVFRGYGEDKKQLNPFTATFKVPQGLSQRQIEKELNKFVSDFERSCFFKISDTNPKLSDFIVEYFKITEKSLAPTTVQYYHRIAEKFIIPKLGDMKISEIKPVHIQRFINDLSNTVKTRQDGKPDKNGEVLSASSIKRYITVLQSIFRQAMKLGLLMDNPAKAEHLSMPKAKAPKTDFFSKQEAVKMLECLADEPLQFQVLVQLAIITGARRGELVALKFSDVDFEGKTILIERAAYKVKGKPAATKAPKDYETRIIAIDSVCIELIKQLKEEKKAEQATLGNQWKDEDWLFTQWNGGMMNPTAPTKAFSKFLDQNGLAHHKFHSLRHTSATLLLYAGVNIKQVQGRLGHGDIATTNKYLHLIKDADVEAAEKLGKLLKRK